MIIKKNVFARVKHCYRSRWMNKEFRKWIDSHSGRVFKVERERNGSFKLYGVGFWITKEFIEII